MGVIVQYDDVTVSLIPSNAVAVLGYTDGTFANKASMSAAFPKALKTFLSVHGQDFSADGVDSESGDATNAEVVEFVKQKIDQGKMPVVYTFLSNMRSMLDAIYNSGVPREKLKIMCAHVTGEPHICGPQCGFGLVEHVDATQWTFTAEGRSLDESLCLDTFWDRDLVPPKPSDPHGYMRFTDARRRQHVMQYDALRKHPLKNRKNLKVLRRLLLGGAKDVAAEVIKEAPKPGPARQKAWGVDHRGWRYDQLIKRSNGKRLVK